MMDAKGADNNHHQQPERSHVSAQLIGLSDDNSHLVVRAAGKEYSLEITSRLRQLIRESSRTAITAPPGGPWPTSSEPSLTPREIQSRIRSGETAEDVADNADISLDMVRRYEGPVLAERAYVVEEAKKASVSTTPDAPALGEISVDRLAARDVKANDLHWDAHRHHNDPWVVTLKFEAGERDRLASWTFDMQSRTVSALDDEARWLTEVEEQRDAPIPSHLTPIPDGVYDVDRDGGGLQSEPVDQEFPSADTPAVDPGDFFAGQQNLLDELSSRRGRRQPVINETDFQDAGSNDLPGDSSPLNEGNYAEALFGDVPAAHPPASRPDLAVDAEVLQLPETHRDEATANSSTLHDASSTSSSAEATEGDQSEATKTPEDKPTKTPGTRRGRRSSVPSWDEIVFGARSD